MNESPRTERASEPRIAWRTVDDRRPLARPDRWLLLVHQLPPEPGSFRMKVWRRLQTLGAVALKSSVYVLPNTERAREDFEWLLREILEGGGEGSVCEARLVDGVTDEQVEALFQAAREADYATIAGEAGDLLAGLESEDHRRGAGRRQARGQLAQLRRRLAAVAAIDFFDAPRRREAERLLTELDTRVNPRPEPETGKTRPVPGHVKGLTWVTRSGVHVDRMASAWLVRRFLDPEASFKFVTVNRYRPRAGELRFDMFEAEFTHEGDRCTFEVLLDAAGLDEPALLEIGQIVHDIDLNDDKFGREDRTGVQRLIEGIALTHAADEDRLGRAAALFDDLYAYFRRSGAGARPRVSAARPSQGVATGKGVGGKTRPMRKAGARRETRGQKRPR
jgi:hypothetical protein